jgi:hypothetical protein
MFPKRCRVTARHDFDNESTGRREVVAIFKNRNFVPTGASNPRQAHRQKGSEALPVESDLLDAGFSEFHSDSCGGVGFTRVTDVRNLWHYTCFQGFI